MPLSLEDDISSTIPLSALEELPSDYESLLNGDGETKPPNHRSQSYIIRLVLGMAGIQVAFSIQFASGISYFRSLGTSQTAATLFWLIPPVCGSLLQPVFGRWSDVHGSRKPFIVAGSAGIVVALLGYAWSPDLAARVSGAGPGRPSPSVLPQLSVSFFFLMLNVAIQPAQSGLRALVVDECDAGHHQVEATAWASRIGFVASMASYLAAASDLTGLFPFETTQLQALVSLSIVVVVTSVGVTCCAVSERTETPAAPSEATGGVLDTWRMLSPRLRRIYLSQFFSWFAWFPVLVQITSFINTLSCSSQTSPRQDDDNCHSSGPSALFDQASVALAMSAVLPPLVRWASSARWGLGHKSPSDYLPYHARSESQALQVLWLVSQVLFSILLSSTFFKSGTLAVVAVALSGVCWCVTQWVPFVLANEEVIRIEGKRTLAGLDSCTGLLLGAHNTFIASPQILATAVSSLLFEVIEAVGISDPLNNVLWVFSTSIIMSLIAALLISRL